MSTHAHKKHTKNFMTLFIPLVCRTELKLTGSGAADFRHANTMPRGGSIIAIRERRVKDKSGLSSPTERRGEFCPKVMFISYFCMMNGYFPLFIMSDVCGGLGSAAQAHRGVVSGAAGKLGDGIGLRLEPEVFAVGGEIGLYHLVGGDFSRAPVHLFVVLEKTSSFLRSATLT